MSPIATQLLRFSEALVKPRQAAVEELELAQIATPTDLLVHVLRLAARQAVHLRVLQMAAAVERLVEVAGQSFEYRVCSLGIVVLVVQPVPKAMNFQALQAEFVSLKVDHRVVSLA